MVSLLHWRRLPHALGTIYERTNASLEAAGFGGMGSASKPRQGSRVVQVPVGHAVGAAHAGTGDKGGLWVPDGGIVEHANGLPPAGGGGQAGPFAAGTRQSVGYGKRGCIQV